MSYVTSGQNAEIQSAPKESSADMESTGQRPTHIFWYFPYLDLSIELDIPCEPQANQKIMERLNTDIDGRQKEAVAVATKPEGTKARPSPTSNTQSLETLQDLNLSLAASDSADEDTKDAASKRSLSPESRAPDDDSGIRRPGKEKGTIVWQIQPVSRCNRVEHDRVWFRTQASENSGKPEGASASMGFRQRIPPTVPSVQTVVCDRPRSKPSLMCVQRRWARDGGSISPSVRAFDPPQPACGLPRLLPPPRSSRTDVRARAPSCRGRSTASLC